MPASLVSFRFAVTNHKDKKSG